MLSLDEVHDRRMGLDAVVVPYPHPQGQYGQSIPVERKSNYLKTFSLFTFLYLS